VRGRSCFSRRYSSRVQLITEAGLLLIGKGLIAGLFAGSIGGAMAGLAGLGGGLIYVPILYLLLPGKSDGMALAVMTSLMAVFLTGLFSSYAHWRLHHVDKALSRNLIPWLGTGAVAGLWTTLRVPEALILLGLAFLDIWIAWDLGRKRTWKSRAGLPAIGLPIGFLSGTLGIGGGAMLVPIFRRLVSLRHAVGTSAFCATTMAGLAVMVNMALEHHWPLLMGSHLFLVSGFLAGVVFIVSPASRLTAAMHRSYPEPQIRIILRIVFFTMAVFLVILSLFGR